MWRDWMKRPKKGIALTSWWVKKRKTEKEMEKKLEYDMIARGLQRLAAQNCTRWTLCCKNRLTPTWKENLLGSTNRRKMHTSGGKWWRRGFDLELQKDNYGSWFVISTSFIKHVPSKFPGVFLPQTAKRKLNHIKIETRRSSNTRKSMKPCQEVNESHSKEMPKSRTAKDAAVSAIKWLAECGGRMLDWLGSSSNLTRKLTNKKSYFHHF